MVSTTQKRKLAIAALVLSGGIIAAYTLTIGGTNAILYVVLGLLMAAVGITMSRGKNRQTTYALVAAGILSLVMAVGRASIYGPVNGLAVALFVLSLVMLLRGYQYSQVS